jgi:hypothetical protein
MQDYKRIQGENELTYLAPRRPNFTSNRNDVSFQEPIGKSMQFFSDVFEVLVSFFLWVEIMVIYSWALLFIFHYLHVDSFTYAFGWSALVCRIKFFNPLVVIFFK